MRDDVKKYIYGTLIVFILGVATWLAIVFVNACGFSLACNQAALPIDRTPIPTLIPATMPAPTRFVIDVNATMIPTATEVASANPDVARPSNSGGPGGAVDLKGDVTAGAQIFAENCVACHAAEGKGGVNNPGSTDGTVPALNPIDPTLIDSNPVTYATNLDLFLQHGSTPAGVSPAFKMPAWGDLGTLTQQQIADVIAYVMSLNPAPAAATATPAPVDNVARPSNPGGTGDAVNLTGNADSGKQIFATNCVVCHAAEGKGGIANPGSTDGTVPALNPIDPTLKSKDYKTFAGNVDLFIQHGSTPAGSNPTFQMPAWGDVGTLSQQQIADVIAYLISLNP